MTLQERLNKYIEKYCLSGAEAARRTGLNVTQISSIRVRNQYSAATAEKIYKAFGDEFREYFEYEKCHYCGSEYIPRDERQKTCLSDECVKKHRAEVVKEYERKVNSGEHVMRTYNERRPKKKKYLVVGDVKPAEPLKEYNERARREFGSYGERSKAEQLARSMTMRESMGLR